MKFSILSCGACGQRNRINLERSGATVCGRCAKPLEASKYATNETDQKIVRCLKCGQANRIDPTKSEEARCGACQADLAVIHRPPKNHRFGPRSNYYSSPGPVFIMGWSGWLCVLSFLLFCLYNALPDHIPVNLVKTAAFIAFVSIIGRGLLAILNPVIDGVGEVVESTAKVARVTGEIVAEGCGASKETAKKVGEIAGYAAVSGLVGGVFDGAGEFADGESVAHVGAESAVSSPEAGRLEAHSDNELPSESPKAFRYEEEGIPALGTRPVAIDPITGEAFEPGQAARPDHTFGRPSEVDGDPRTDHYVEGYYRSDGTYVRGHWKSKKG